MSMVKLVLRSPALRDRVACVMAVAVAALVSGAALGEGKGVVRVALVGNAGDVLGQASATYEIMADPFAE